MKSNNEVKTIPEGKGQFDMIDFQFEDSTSENAKNQLNMYMHPDGLYHASKPSWIFMSWSYFKQMFQMISNGFKNKKGEEVNILQKIWVVGCVIFTCTGCLSLLIALGVFIDVGIGSLFFICLGLGSSLLGIVAIGIIIFGAIHRKTMGKIEIYVYFYSNIVGENQKTLFANGRGKCWVKSKGFQPCDVKNINTENLVIPESEVYGGE